MTAKRTAPDPRATTPAPIPESIASANGHHKPATVTARSTAWAHLLRTFAELAPNADSQPLEILLAAVQAHRSSGLPVWLNLYGPPSNGKTLLLDTLPAIVPPEEDGEQVVSDSRAIIRVDGLTARSLFSGLKNTKHVGMLERVTNAVLVVKDLSSLLKSSGGPVVFSQLRRVYDGESVYVYGSGKNSNWSGRLTFICASVDHPWSMDAELGARLLTVTMRSSEFAEGLASNDGRSQLKEAVQAVLELLPYDIHGSMRTVVAPFAEALAAMRATIKRDPRSRELVGMPTEEAPHRISGQLASLAASLQSLNGGDKQRALAAVRRVTADSVPAYRRYVLASLAASASGVSVTKVGRFAHERTGYKVNHEMVRRAAQELSMLDLVDFGDDDPKDDGEAMVATVQDGIDSAPEAGTGKRGAPGKLVTRGRRWRLLDAAPGLLKDL